MAALRAYHASLQQTAEGVLRDLCATKFEGFTCVYVDYVLDNKGHCLSFYASEKPKHWYAMGSLEPSQDILPDVFRRLGAGVVESIVVYSTSADDAKKLRAHGRLEEHPAGALKDRYKFVASFADISAWRLQSFWTVTLKEFIEKTWHPDRVLKWCLPHDEVADITS